MKKWRFDILIELYDLPDDAHIMVSEPAPEGGMDMYAADLCYGGVMDRSIPYGRFCEMRDNGDLELHPNRGPSIIPEGLKITYYRIAQGGKSALQALPNFYRRAERQRKVMV